MIFALFIRAGLLVSMMPSRGLLVTAASTNASSEASSTDPCAKIAGLDFVDTKDAMACQMSFPFNETLRQNVLSVVSRVLDFYTFENFYLKSPPPFEESTKDIRAEIARMNATQYATDYDFNRDMWDFTTQLNDGHTRWFPSCYNSYQNIMPALVVILDDGIFVAPDVAEIFSSEFASFFAAKNVNYQRLAGARILTIEGLPASAYIDKVASTISGDYLDHNARVNSAVASYRLSDAQLSLRFGDLASSNFLTQTSLTFSLIAVNSTSSETVEVPFAAVFVGNSFTDGKSYWANNCAPKNTTNGVDFMSRSSDASQSHARGTRVDLTHPKTRITLPNRFDSALTLTTESTSVIKSLILRGNKTGVMFVGSFEGDFDQFPLDVDAAVKQFKTAGVTNLVIDVTNNGGGYICLGMFLYQYLAGTRAGSPRYQTTSRANSLALDIVKANVALGLNGSTSLYASDNWRFPNGSRMPEGLNYNNPSLFSMINSRNDSTSQRFEDSCPNPNVTMPENPPFDLKNVIIVSNANCASTCGQLTSSMYERQKIRMVVFGGNQSQSTEYKGMAGAEVLEFSDLDSQIKTAGFKDDTRAPPDLLVDANMRVNWRTAYSALNKSVPLAYLSEQPQYRFPYTAQTYSNPVNLWYFVEKQFFE